MKHVCGIVWSTVTIVIIHNLFSKNIIKSVTSFDCKGSGWWKKYLHYLQRTWFKNPNNKSTLVRLDSFPTSLSPPSWIRSADVAFTTVKTVLQCTDCRLSQFLPQNLFRLWTNWQTVQCFLLSSSAPSWMPIIEPSWMAMTAPFSWRWSAEKQPAKCKTTMPSLS